MRRELPEGAGIGAGPRVIAKEHRSGRPDVRDTLDELAAVVARVAGEHDVSDPWSTDRSHHQQAVAGLQGGSHRPAANLDHVDPTPGDQGAADESEEEQGATPRGHRPRRVAR
jgi:hypothetical protein